MNLGSLLLNPRSVVILTCASIVVPAFNVCAQDTQSPSATSELEEVVVVGSRIRRDSDSNLDNIQTLNSADLDRTGLASIGDILRQIPSAGSPLEHAVQ